MSDSKPTMLSEVVRELAMSDNDDPVLMAGVRGSIQMLNEDVKQHTRFVADPDMIRKHRARLRAALLAMAAELRYEESV